MQAREAALRKGSENEQRGQRWSPGNRARLLPRAVQRRSSQRHVNRAPAPHVDSKGRPRHDPRRDRRSTPFRRGLGHGPEPYGTCRTPATPDLTPYSRCRTLGSTRPDLHPHGSGTASRHPPTPAHSQPLPDAPRSPRSTRRFPVAGRAAGERRRPSGAPTRPHRLVQRRNQALRPHQEQQCHRPGGWQMRRGSIPPIREIRPTLVSPRPRPTHSPPDATSQAGPAPEASCWETIPSPAVHFLVFICITFPRAIEVRRFDWHPVSAAPMVDLFEVGLTLPTYPPLPPRVDAR